LKYFQIKRIYQTLSIVAKTWYHLQIMRTYELMIVMTPDFPHEDEKKRVELVSKLLYEQQTKSVVIADLGKKRLAYEIKKLNDGCYLLVTIECDAINAAKIEQQVKLSPAVLRYLLTRRE
jgi:small subunit ribosomal protein S6